MIVVEKNQVRRRDKRVWYLVGVVFVAVFLFTFLTHSFKNQAEEVDAANLASFDPGYIISDYQMSNYNTMNESQIQSFLYSKNSCNDRNLSRYTAGDKVNYFSETSPPRTWHIANGHFVCMADEVFDGGTAAHIIYQAAQDYRINPQVLLVLLEKEQSLVRDTFPHSQQYRSATGYGCPDTAACSSKYYGLKNQIRNAAALFRTVLDGGWTNYPLGNNYIQYNPSASCGGSIVNIRNLATSALYRYTPYQPNGATLGGWNDGCNAYGNMNFYSFFQDWFGGITTTKINDSTIPDGSYQITSKDNSVIALDVQGGVYEGMSSGNIIPFYKKSFNSTIENQTFEVRYEYSTGFYRIYNQFTGLYLEVNDDKVVITEKSNGCNQKWLLERDNQGFYKIMSACDNRMVNLGTEDNVSVVSANNSNIGKWKFFEISEETRSLEDGLYYINTAMSQNYVLDISGEVSKYTSSGDTGLWYKKGLNENIENQIFDVKYNSDTGYYQIINHISGLSLDVQGASTANSTKIIAWPKNNGCNQQWMIKKNGTSYEIISACSGKNIDVSGGKAELRQSIIIFPRTNGVNQKWNFEKVNKEVNFEGNYQIKIKQNYYALGLNNYKNNYLDYDNAIIGNYGNKDKDSILTLERVDESEYYYIYNPDTKLYLDVQGASTENSAAVIFWEFNGNCNQKWGINRSDLGYYTIYSACSNKSLDVQGGDIFSGAKIIIFPKHGGINQQWVIYKNS